MNITQLNYSNDEYRELHRTDTNFRHEVNEIK